MVAEKAVKAVEASQGTAEAVIPMVVTRAAEVKAVDMAKAMVEAVEIAVEMVEMPAVAVVQAAPVATVAAMAGLAVLERQVGARVAARPLMVRCDCKRWSRH